MKKLLVIVGASILLVGCSNNLENGNNQIAENNYLAGKSFYEKSSGDAGILLFESIKKRNDSLATIERRKKDSLDRIETEPEKGGGN